MKEYNYEKKKILILTPYYVPGVNGGGPIQSIKNITDHLSDMFDFYILTADRDFKETNRYQNIEINKWVTIDNAKVYYMDMENYSIKSLENIINNLEYDILYLNGFFEFKFSILPIILMKLRRIKEKNTIIAPRGEFSKGALNIKKTKKKIYIMISKLFGIYKNINWHATTDLEKIDIINGYRASNKIYIANNLGKKHNNNIYNKPYKKTKGSLNLVFLSRISVKKNLKFALETLMNVEGDIKFDIYGPIEDNSYWNECKELIDLMPKNVVVEYKGILNNKDVVKYLNKYDIFYLPTYGENFGHVILEAFLSGCPTIISNQTPWRELEDKNVGWDIDLNDKEKFKSIIENCVNMEFEEYINMSQSAFNFGIKNLEDKKNILKTKQLFDLT